MSIVQVKALLVLAVALFACYLTEAKLRKLGCYNDSSEKRAMPVLIANFRRSDIDWNDLRRSVITKCKEMTKERRYKCFGIQFYAECWSGEEACTEYKRYGESQECFCSGDDYKKHKKYEPCKDPVGGEYANFVYEIDD
ncbi:unnamed protein product [Porites lobata]|uniref:Uncharacterized protein n=1 Tax=Porites lobata TaxID=104759 RepID=A0ABN8QWX2_9CNID|nr:unnamed protein product [Porites lobata]